MKTIVHELFEKMSMWYCYYTMKKEDNPTIAIYSSLAQGAHIQMMLCYRYLHSDLTDEMFIEKLRDSIETFLKTAEKSAMKEGRDAEKIAVRIRDTSKMAYMMLAQHVQAKSAIKNVYTCHECGWVGMDEIPDKCPLCGKKLN